MDGSCILYMKGKNTDKGNYCLKPILKTAI
jgi:hypothetical protein